MELYGTLGPGCADADTLEAMFAEGMTGVRLNLSHTTLRAAAPMAEALHAAAARCGIKAKLLIDMQGPELPALQKRIAAACRAAGRPFMVVTQMLASMERSPVPTRAEVSDVFNAVLDGASSLMVTGETAVGQYPAEVIRYLARTACQAERYLRG